MVSTGLHIQPENNTDKILVGFQNADLDEGYWGINTRWGGYGGTYKSCDPRRSPKRFIKHLSSHLIHVRWDLWWTKFRIVVPDDVIQLFDTEIVHRIEYDNPHYVVSCITCA